MQTLLLFSHTYWEQSKVNKALLESAKTLSNISIHNLNTTYPDGDIHLQSELELLKKADRIVCQFPLFWFSTPAIMKEWQDKVLSHIHYSDNPRALEHKKFSIITTAGGEASSYDGHHGYSLDTLLSPIYNAFAYSYCDVDKKAYCIYKANVDNLPINEYLARLQR